MPNDRSVGIQGCVNEETETSASKSTTSSSTLTTTTEKVCEKTISGLPTSPASKDSISSNSETRLKSTSKIITSNIKITTTTSPMTSSMSAPSTSIQHEMKDENLKTETEKLKIEKTTSLTSAPVEVPMKISSEDVHMPNFPTTPAMSHVTAVRQIHSTTNYLETEEIVRVTRTLGVELGRNTNEIPDQKMNPSWFQAMWHIEILAIIGMGWLLCFFFMMCGLATCICKCRTRYSLKSKFEKSEEERKKILKAYNDAENSNREWLHRMFESKRQSGEVQMTSCEVQTDRPLTPPARPRTPVMMRTDRLSGVPVRGILKPSLKPVNSYSLNRFVKEDQGVRAKSFHPKASSIEIPLEKLVPAPKLNQVQFAKEMTVHIISPAMDCGCVYNQDLSHI